MSTLNISLSESTDAEDRKEVTLALVGHLDNSTVASLQMQLSTALSAKPSHVIFDLANLRYVTSSGAAGAKAPPKCAMPACHLTNSSGAPSAKPALKKNKP